MVAPKESAIVKRMVPAGLFLLIAVTYFWLALKLPSVLISPKGMDLYFGADCPRVFANLAFRNSIHYRTSVHPLFSLTNWPVFQGLWMLGGRSYSFAMAAYSSLVAGASAVVFYAVARYISGQRSILAVGVTLLAFVSAGWIYWMPIPETFPIGAFTIVLATWMLTRKQRGIYTAIVMMLLTLSQTITNVMFGVIGVFVTARNRFILLAGGVTFLVAATLAVVQLLAFPTSVPFFLPQVLAQERTYLTLNPGQWFPRIYDFFAHSYMVSDVLFLTPELIGVTDRANNELTTLLVMVATAVWLALLLIGFRVILKSWAENTIGRYLIFALAGQLALHTVYGDSPFLYSSHFLPLEVLIALVGLVKLKKRWAYMLLIFLSASGIYVNGNSVMHGYSLLESMTP